MVPRCGRGLVVTFRRQPVEKMPIDGGEVETVQHLAQISMLYFFHICNFEICHEIQIPKDENKSQLSRAINYSTWRNVFLYTMWLYCRCSNRLSSSVELSQSRQWIRIGACGFKSVNL